MISTTDAVLIQLESRRLFWRIFFGTQGNTRRDSTCIDNSEDDAGMSWCDLICRSRLSEQFVPLARSI
jgi:hypothetical protein